MKKKITVYTLAEGGYRDVRARTFASYDEAYAEMKELYEDVKFAQEVEESEDDGVKCYIDTLYAEVYSDKNSLEDQWIACISEDTIEIDA